MLKIAKGLKIENLTKAIPEQLHHAHCSGIVAFPDGELVVVWYWAIHEANRDQKIYLSRKTPETLEWTEPKPLPKTNKLMFDGNPVLWIAPDTQKLWLFYLIGFGWSVCIPKYRISDDRGETWTKPKNLYPFISRGLKNPPILTSWGEYVLPSYVEFKYLRGVFFLSTNQGRTWKQSRKVDLSKDIIPPGYEQKKGRMCEQPTVIERDDGSLFALMRNDGQPMKKMLQSSSYDKGKTWSDAQNYILPNPASGFHMIKLKSGNIAIIYNHAPGPNNDRKWRNPLSIALSEDSAKSWKYRRNLVEWHPDSNKDNSGKQITFEYPTITQDDNNDGMIHATWSFSHPENIEGKEYRFTDIQYTKFSEDWIKEKLYFENSWEEGMQS